ncbi:MAG: damage-control phosphatase ARMT1 family protein [Lachnospiraceae bacterium]
MKADKECFECCRNKVSGLLEQYQASESVRDRVTIDIEKVLADAKEKSAPVLMAEVISIVEKSLDISDAYDIPKKKYNHILMEKESAIREEIAKEADIFLAGIQYAITGNYIDFGAMSDVNEDKLNELLNNRKAIRLDKTELGNLQNELRQAKRLAYITDNAGEIVLDKVFIGVMKELYPELEIGVIVRGFPVLNDATCDDAKEVELTESVTVIPNGSDVPGTPLGEISREAKEWIESADLCIAKGQGNFETLRGCGKNIYYLFLCKCELFVKKFGVERFTPVLSNEKRIVQYA